MLTERLIPYGFVRADGGFYFSTKISKGQFRLNVTILGDGSVNTQLIDCISNEEYVLHRVTGTVGAFIGAVREAYESIMLDIAARCFAETVFKSEQAQELISYICKVYGDELEYLWQPVSDNAVWRRQDNRKWYGVVLKVLGHKLGLESDELIEIIDLRSEPDKLPALIDNQKYFLGWHMNKKSWYTVILDGLVPSSELYRLVDKSRLLAIK